MSRRYCRRISGCQDAAMRVMNFQIQQQTKDETSEARVGDARAVGIMLMTTSRRQTGRD